MPFSCSCFDLIRDSIKWVVKNVFFFLLLHCLPPSIFLLLMRARACISLPSFLPSFINPEFLFFLTHSFTRSLTQSFPSGAHHTPTRQNETEKRKNIPKTFSSPPPASQLPSCLRCSGCLLPCSSCHLIHTQRASLPFPPFPSLPSPLYLFLRVKIAVRESSFRLRRCG